MFSVLISIYRTERPVILERCLRSIWDDQLVKPSQIVLVIDGPVHTDLLRVIECFKARLVSIVDVIQLKQNKGLGEALAVGLKHVRYDLVARMDTDDVSLPNRFQAQLDFMLQNEGVHVLGSHVEEFNSDPMEITGTRRVPLYHADIVKTAKYRNPMNHPSVMYRKSRVIDSGGPLKFVGFDDYFLWVRMIQNGAEFRNLDSVLVRLQAGPNLLLRRSGLKYAKMELNFQRTILRLGFIGNQRFIFNLMSRFAVRLLPNAILFVLYKRFRKS